MILLNYNEVSICVVLITVIEISAIKVALTKPYRLAITIDLAMVALTRIIRAETVATDARIDAITDVRTDVKADARIDAVVALMQLTTVIGHVIIDAAATSHR